MNFNKEQIIDSISTHYSPLSGQCKTDFKDLSKVWTFDKSTMLVREGQYADKTYFIVQGCARAFYLKDGKDITQRIPLTHIASYLGITLETLSRIRNPRNRI